MERDELTELLIRQMKGSPQITETAQTLAHYAMACCSWDSPLERLFFAAWLARQAIERLGGHDEIVVSLARQHPVEYGGRSYRLDFAISCSHRELAVAWNELVAVEIDGHDFHERTKEQVIYRDARDRYLQAAGWKVFHFSGSAVFRAPGRCVDEVYDYCLSRYVEAVTAHERALLNRVYADVREGA